VALHQMVSCWPVYRC